MIQTGVLVSGNLGFDCLKLLSREVEVVFVFTNTNSYEIIEWCKKHSVSCFVGNPRNGKAKEFIQDKPVDLILSINYLYLVEEDILSFPKQYAINLHGSLLPKYRGRTPHVWAIINGESEVGVTAHIMTSGCDEGAIISQLTVQVDSDDTGADILGKYSKVYPLVLTEVLEAIKNDSVTLIDQDDSKATFFGKRTPEDGEINWSWHRGRINNWIRAQTNPYPGAFTFYESYKVIINKSTFSDYGFSSTQADGTILKVGTDFLIVKTPNGALQVSELEVDQKIEFREDKMLHGRHQDS